MSNQMHVNNIITIGTWQLQFKINSAQLNLISEIVGEQKTLVQLRSTQQMCDL